MPSYNKMKQYATSDAQRNWGTGITGHKKSGEAEASP